MPEKLKALLKEWEENPAAIPRVLVLGCLASIGVAYLLGDGWVPWSSLKTGIEPAWRIAVILGGLYGLSLATKRGDIADKQAIAAQDQVAAAQDQVAESIKQTDIASHSNHAQRYEKASEMLWHREEAGMREAGCYALKSLGLEGDIGMAMQCRDLLVSFIQRSAPTLEQKESEPKQEGLSRSDIIAADHALSSLYRKWCDSKEFIRFRLNRIPSWFWGDIPAMWRPVSTRDYPGADFSWADLSNAILRSADLSNANLRTADLRKAILSNANLRTADLRNADLRKADLSLAALRTADLRNADLRKADLSLAALRNADLRNADLRKANLSWAILSNANLSWAILRNANLRIASLSIADLSNANLSWANLSNANLRKADLRKANLRKANLRNADLSNANLSIADFRGDGSEDQAAKGLTPEQIGSAVWGRTLGPPKLPDYLAVDVNKMAEPLPEKH